MAAPLFREVEIFFFRMRARARAIIMSMTVKAKLPTPLLAHQPLSFKFPKSEFGEKSVVKRSFQPQWFARWKWLHYMYDEERELAFCSRA